MELIQKIRGDLGKLDRIESKFFRDLICLLYTQTIQHNLIPNETQHFFGVENHMDILLDWYEKNKHIEARDRKAHLPLGKYAEELLLFYLENNDEIELLGHNLQLIENKITLGELDYLFANHKEHIFIHLELAIKFYLKTSLNGQEIYLGPSAKDWMKRKLKKLIHQQLPLSEKRKDLLPHALQNKTFNTKLYLKGSLFLPFEEWETQSYNILNCGWWASITNFNSVIKLNYSYHLITNKSNWIFPFDSRLKSYTAEEVLRLSNEFLEVRNEVMICRFDTKNQLLDRGFLVRTNWPL